MHHRYCPFTLLLDALYQWATTPTGVTAIKNGYNPNHELIKENLKIRYNLPPEEAEKIFKGLIEGIESAGLDFATGFNEVKEEIKIYFNNDMVLKDATIQRLNSASEEEKYIAWFWLFYKKNDNGYLNSDKYDYQDITRFQAILNATFNIIYSGEEIFSILIKLGVINELNWIRSDGHKVSDSFIIPHYLEGCIEELEKVTNLPELPDFGGYIDKLYKKKRLNVLIALESILEKGYMGCMEDKEITGKIVPFPYIIGKAENTFAINPKIYEALNDYFFKKKDSETIELEKTVTRILNELYEIYFPDVGFVNECFIKGTKAWEIIINDRSLSDKDVFIILTPRLSGPQLEKLREKASNEYVMILTTMMGIPELDILYRKTFSKNMNEDNGLNLIIIDLTKDKINERIINAKPEVCKEIITRLKGGEVPKDIELIAYKLFSDFEKKFREFVIYQLKNNYGQEWWKHGITKYIQGKCLKRQEKNIKNKNSHSELFDYMDFTDLYFLIECEQNRDIFYSFFPHELDRLKIRLFELSDIRNKIMHSRVINDEDISIIKQYVKDIYKWIKEPRLI